MSRHDGTMAVTDGESGESAEIVAMRRQCYRALVDLGRARDRLSTTTLHLYAAVTTAIGVTALAIFLACVRGCK